MIRAKHVWQELMKPEDFNKLDDMRALYDNLYKAIYTNVRISLDIRHALFNIPSIQKLEKNVKFEVVKTPNAVIKSTDNVRVENEKE
jgi:hypothetical protein